MELMEEGLRELLFVLKLYGGRMTIEELLEWAKGNLVMLYMLLKEAERRGEVILVGTFPESDPIFPLPREVRMKVAPIVFHLCPFDRRFMSFIEFGGRRLFEFCSCGFVVEDIEEGMPRSIIASMLEMIIGELQDTDKVIPKGDSVYGLVENKCPYCGNELINVLLVGSKEHKKDPPSLDLFKMTICSTHGRITPHIIIKEFTEVAKENIPTIKLLLEKFKNFRY
jgi:hypothetical protein